jgi:RNA polymerase sigma-70 factor (ECF subfamily)
MDLRLERFIHHVYRFALRITRDPHQAEDLTQEVMLRAWQKADGLREPRAARVWLLRIASNIWRDGNRRQRRRPPTELLPEDMSGQRSDRSPVLAMIERENLRRAVEALDALPDHQRQAVYLHACEGLSLSEVADVLGISYQAAKASLCAGRTRLREKLADMLPSNNTTKS